MSDAIQVLISPQAVYEELASHGLLTDFQWAHSGLNKEKKQLTTKINEKTRDFILLVYRGAHYDAHKNLTLKQLIPYWVILEDASYINQLPKDTSWFLTKNARQAWALLSAKAWGHPQKKMKILAVTGTNGKTSTVWLASQLLSQRHIKHACLGTLGFFLDGYFEKFNQTTPDPPYFFAKLSQAYEQGARVCVMEASSIALDQKRFYPTVFDAAAWTSFSHDHLDYHQDMPSYWQAKQSLFEQFLHKDSRVILALDIMEHEYFKQADWAFNDQWIYGASHLVGCQISYDQRVLTYQMTDELHKTTLALYRNFTLEQKGAWPFFSSFMAENFCAAYLLVDKVIDLSAVKVDFQKLKQVPGRLECWRTPSQAQIVVDYAHTPDALEKTLKTIRSQTSGRVILVVGCGGNRDPKKRPMMGQIAAKYADMIFLTNDNPRFEDPRQIINDMIKGIPEPIHVITLEDRRQAIREAMGQLTNGDCLLIAGKGHETHMEVAGQMIEFDDRQVVGEILRELADR